MRASIPNILTLVRVALTAVVIALLSIYNHPSAFTWAVPVAGLVFILAALTDTLDGILARRWDAISVFGRVMDPFADKALVLGSFVVMAGPGFTSADGHAVAGFTPWMVVIILARELLVTSIRSVMEGTGHSFAANWAGKWKMIIQSVAVPAILALLWLAPSDELLDPVLWARVAIDALAWITLIITVVSGAPYFIAATRAATESKGAAE